MSTFRGVVCALAIGLLPGLGFAQDLSKLSQDERANLLKKLETRLEQLKAETEEVSNLVKKVKSFEGDKKPDVKKPDAPREPKAPEFGRSGPGGQPMGRGAGGPPPIGGPGVPPIGGGGRGPGGPGDRGPGGPPMGGGFGGSFGGGGFSGSGFGGVMMSNPAALWDIMGGQGQDKVNLNENARMKANLERMGVELPKDGVLTKDAFIKTLEQRMRERSGAAGPIRKSDPNESTEVFRVIRLKNASADEAARVLTEVFNGPQQQGRGSPFNMIAGAQEEKPSRVRIVADRASNSLIVVKASPADLAAIDKLLESAIDSGSKAKDEPAPRGPGPIGGFGGPGGPGFGGFGGQMPGGPGFGNPGFGGPGLQMPKGPVPELSRPKSGKEKDPQLPGRQMPSDRGPRFDEAPLPRPMSPVPDRGPRVDQAPMPRIMSNPPARPEPRNEMRELIERLERLEREIAAIRRDSRR